MKLMLSVVVPCYNEAKSLLSLARRFSECDPLSNGFELVLVDNGSTDDSRSVLKWIGRRHKFVRIVTVKKNMGYGNGVYRGLRVCRGDFLCWTHADLQTDPLDATRAYRIATAQERPACCFVKGARKNRLPADSFFTLGMSIFAAITLGQWLPDINAQPNLFHKSFLTRLNGPPKDFSFDLFAFFMAKKSGLRIIRFPVDFSSRKYGQSHWNTSFAGKWKFIKRTALYVMALRGHLERV